MIAFWCSGDRDQCARLFQGSALYREDKWPRERDKVLEIAYSRGDFYRWPAPDARVPLSILDSAPVVAGGVADYLAMPHDALARLAAELAAVAAERGRRLDAIDDLLLCAEMSETEKVTAYAVVKTAAVAQGRQPDAAPTHKIVVNQKAIAGDIGLSRQTIGKKLQIWSGQGYMGKETRGTGRFTKEGREIKETVLSLPGRSLTDNLAMASTWHRPPDAKRHGGNGNRCPQCAGTTIKTEIETKTVVTKTRRCADCGYIHTQPRRMVGKPTTTYSFSDDTTPPMLDLAAMRGHTVSKMDTPPIPPAPDRDRARRGRGRRAPVAPPVAPLTPPPCGTSVQPATPPRCKNAANPVFGCVSPPAPPVASWDGTHPCRDCGATGYARSGTVPRCLPCTRGRPDEPWGDVAAGGGGE